MLSIDRLASNDEMFRKDVIENYARCTKNNRINFPFMVSNERISIHGNTITINFSKEVVETTDTFLITSSDSITESIKYIKNDSNTIHYEGYIDMKRAKIGEDLKYIRYIGLSPGSMGDRNIRRLHYLYTVPLDIITFPIQVIIIFVIYPTC
jgi:hypothetical protein